MFVEAWTFATHTHRAPLDLALPAGSLARAKKALAQHCRDSRLLAAFLSITDTADPTAAACFSTAPAAPLLPIFCALHGCQPACSCHISLPRASPPASHSPPLMPAYHCRMRLRTASACLPLTPPLCRLASSTFGPLRLPDTCVVGRVARYHPHHVYAYVGCRSDAFTTTTFCALLRCSYVAFYVLVVRWIRSLRFTLRCVYVSLPTCAVAFNGRGWLSFGYGLTALRTFSFTFPGAPPPPPCPARSPPPTLTTTTNSPTHRLSGSVVVVRSGCATVWLVSTALRVSRYRATTCSVCCALPFVLRFVLVGHARGVRADGIQFFVVVRVGQRKKP